MSNSKWILTTLVLTAFSCSQRGSTPIEPRAVKVAQVSQIDYIERDFAGMATADDAVNLAFKISGQLLSVDVAKGDYVEKGALLARLDSRDVELQVASDRSQYERSRSQYERMRRLLEHEAVSEQEFESAQTSYIQAQSTYENSKDLLGETALRAPFSGVIERTYVDTYQRVQSGQTILRLVNPRSTTVEFTMPESSLSLLSDTTTSFSVRFDNFPQLSFAARLDTYAKTASDAYGFPVSLKISKEQASRFGISPGMTCQVSLRSEENSSRELALPLAAIYAPTQGGEYVWRVVDKERVELTRVELGSIFGRDMVVIRSGLKSGDVVVVAGVYRLQDGQRIRIINR